MRKTVFGVVVASLVLLTPPGFDVPRIGNCRTLPNQVACLGGLAIGDLPTDAKIRFSSPHTIRWYIWPDGSVHAQEKTPPAYSEVEQLKIQNLNLKRQLTEALKQISDLQAAIGRCQADLGPLQLSQNKQALDAEQATLKETLEKARPGFTWDPRTGAFTPKPPDQKKDDTKKDDPPK